MKTLADVMQSDPPRLVVMFRRDEMEREDFQWGIAGKGSVPVLTLIGYIARVQSELAFRAPNRCDELALVIVWDAEAHECSYYVHQDIPIDPMVGMLETIKAILVGSRLAQHAAAQKVQIARPAPRGGILGPDGLPMA